MLYYIGKDISRWTEQCTETAVASPCFTGRCIRPETFAVFLIQYIPAHVRTKLEAWGVLDFCSLFRRSIGLHAVLSGHADRREFHSRAFYAAIIDTWTTGMNSGLKTPRSSGRNRKNLSSICTLPASTR